MNSIRMVIFLATAILFAACSSEGGDANTRQPEGDTVFQYSTVDALLGGLFDGELTIGEAAGYGDMGLGTINAVDGELIALDGEFYTARGDGTVRQLTSADKTPFVVLARFKPEHEAGLPEGLAYRALQKLMDRLLISGNDMHAIRIDGTFKTMTVRSEPKQSPPYRPLAQVLKDEEVTFELENVTGSMIGFHLPDYLGGLNVPGYHFHFISEDRSQGGHVVAFETQSGRLQIDTLSRFEMLLPRSEAFGQMDLGRKTGSDLNAVEHR